MAKTRKLRKLPSNMGDEGDNTDIPRYAGTMMGIHSWYKCMFQKLGWMVLAKGKGYDHKIENYKISIANLLKTIDHVSKEYESKNRKHDLNVLKMHVLHLQKFVMKKL